MLAPTENTSGRRGNASPIQTDEPGEQLLPVKSRISSDASRRESVPLGAPRAEPETGISFGAGLKVKHAKGFHSLSEWTPSAIADALSGLDPDAESWFAPHRWRDNRRKGDNWLCASCAVCDLDWHDSAGTHAALPQVRADALTLAMRDGKLPGALGYLTPRGARIVAPLSIPVTDAYEYLRACEGLARLCVDALAALGEPLAETGGPAGFKADVTHDLARVFRAPNCKVAGEASLRRAPVTVWRGTPCAVAELLEAAPEPEPAVNAAATVCAYRVTPGGFVWLKSTRDGHVPLALTNWTARIIAQVLRDDGSGQPVRTLEVQADHAGRKTARFTIPAARLANVRRWAVEHLGTGAVVYPGFNAEAHVQTALQLTSGKTPTRVVFTHTGWRQVAGQWVYLHTAGGIDADGARADIETNPQGLALFRLPDPPHGDALREAVAASLRLLEVAPARVALPLFALPWRAVLGKCDATVFLNGRTGARKSELAALIQRFFGPAMNRGNLPASWEHTPNALRALCFHAKDALLVIDDFAPGGTRYDVSAYHRRADQVLRGQNNGQGRGRCRQDGTPVEAKPPRGTLLVTGEDVPRGQSLRARLLVLNLQAASREGADDGDVKLDTLTRCQQDGDAGLYAAALAGFIQWLATGDNLTVAQERVRRAPAAWRAKGGFTHGQTPDHVAGLYAALEVFAEFGQHCGALDADGAPELLTKARAALLEVARLQGDHLASADPVDRFRELLQAAIRSGAAHVAGMNNDTPLRASAWGWEYQGGQEIVGDRIDGYWRAKGARAGWTDGACLYLEPQAAFAAAQGIGNRTGEPLAVSESTLRRQLREKGLLTRTDGMHLTVKVSIAGSRPRVLCLPPSFLLGEDVGPVGQDDDESPNEADSGCPTSDDCVGPDWGDSGASESSAPHNLPRPAGRAEQENRPETRLQGPSAPFAPTAPLSGAYRGTA